MTTPEIIKGPRPIEQVQMIPEQIDVHEKLVEAGVVPTPTTPQSLVQNGQVVAQSTTTPVSTPTASVIVPFDMVAATTLSHGDASDASTWNGVAIIRRIKQALFYGWQVVVGGKPKNESVS